MRYTIQAGDTLGHIAARLDTTVAALVTANPFIEDPNLIFPGAQLELPAGADVPDAIRIGVSAAGFSSTYAIRTGDTLSRIAAHFGIALGDLIASNAQLNDPDRIFPGTVLNVPRALADEQVRVPPPVRHDLPLWMALAKREMDTGVDEISGSRHNPRIVEYHQTTTLRATDDETPWCSSFVNWCIQQADLRGTRSAAARSWLGWGQRLTRPRRGAVTVFSRGSSPTAGHVGFYWGTMGDRILVLGGNQGNQVSIRGYPVRSRLGYRWPS